MTLKDKFAALLRRWASKLSPEKNLAPDELNLPSPFGVKPYEVQRFGMAYDIPPREEAHAHEAEKNGYPDAVKRMRKEYEKRIVHGIVARLWEDGVVEYNMERSPETGVLRIVGFLYVGIRKDNENEITNPFNQ
ncbi:MAG: hypothetical protein HDS69_02215 [Bacteroidales bacterium]|nr:hypothetical protein [Bacteroidales bacterium]